MSRHTFTVLLAILVILVTVAGCIQPTAPIAATTPAVAGGEEKSTEAVEEYVLVALNWQHPYWIDIRRGGDYFQEVMGGKVKVTYAGPDAFDFPAQVDALLAQIPKKPAGVLVGCFDPGLIPAINQVVDAGIPLGTFESDCPAPDNKRWFFVGVNAFSAGYAMGPELIKYMGDSGKIIISTNVGVANSEEKIRGFNTFLESFPNIEVVATVDDKTLVREGADAIKPVLQANPDVTAIVGVNAGSGGAAATAVKELGLEGKVHIICQDRDDITLNFIKEGVIDSTVVTRTADNSYVGLLLLYQYNHFDVPITDDNAANNVNWLPGSVDVGTIVVNKDNVDAFFH